MDKIVQMQDEATRAEEVPPEEPDSRKTSGTKGRRKTKKDFELELEQATRDLEERSGELDRMHEEKHAIEAQLREQLEQAQQTITEFAKRAREAEAHELQVRRHNDELRTALAVSQARIRELLAESQGT